MAQQKQQSGIGGIIGLIVIIITLIIIFASCQDSKKRTTDLVQHDNILFDVSGEDNDDITTTTSQTVFVKVEPAK